MNKCLGLAMLLVVVVVLFAGPAYAAVVVVDDDGVECPRRAAATIQEGVARAKPGDTVRVCPGTYTGNVVVNKRGLKLIAAGASGTVKIVGPGDFGLAIVADDVRVEGFEISGFVDRRDAAGILVGGLFVGDMLNRANGAELERNDSHHNVFGIYLWQSNRNRVRHNTVHHNVDFGGARPTGTGIISFAGDNAQVLAANAARQSGTDNDISYNVAHDNVRLGILVGACTSADLGCAGATGGTRAKLQGTVVGGNELFANSTEIDFSALAVADATGVRLRDNDVHDNLGTGIGVFFSDTVAVQGNAVTNSGQLGVHVEGSDAEPARAVAVAENTVSATAFHGIFIGAATAVSVTENSAHDNGLHGIFIVQARGVLVWRNEADHNAQANPVFAGIRIQTAADVVVAGNETNNNGRGIRVTGSTQDLFTENSAFGNTVVDLDWDGVGTQVFRDNHCATARPSTATWDCRP
jgi:parallel beta-helix repeat protein